MDLEKPQLILSYATRINAEQAVLRGKIFKDKRLQIAWAPVVQTPSSTTIAINNKAATPNADSKATPSDIIKSPKSPSYTPSNIITKSPTYMPYEPDGNNTDTLPELRLEDEEEDEESEDRSWRR